MRKRSKPGGSLRLFTDGRTRGIAAALREQGWRLLLASKSHLRCIPPDPTKPIVVQSGTPGDKRAVENWISQLRRSGFVWNP